MSQVYFIPPFKLDSVNGIVPRQDNALTFANWNVDQLGNASFTSISGIATGITSLGSIDIHSDVDTISTAPVANDVLSWDGANWVPSQSAVQISIGDTVNSGTVNSVLFVGAGGVLQQDNANFTFDSVGKSLRVGFNGTINNANSVIVGGVVSAMGSITASQLGSTNMEYAVGQETGKIRTFKSSGLGNTYSDFDIVLSDSGNVTQQYPFAVDQTAGLIILNEVDGTSPMDVDIQNGNGVSVLYSDSSALNVGIGTTTPQGDARLEVVSGGNKGFMPPKVTVAQARTSFSGFAGMIGLKTFITDFGSMGKEFQVIDSGGFNNEWISTESVTLAFGRNGSSDGVYLRYGGNSTNSGTGWVAPYDGRLREITAIETGGNPTKNLIVEIYDAGGVLQTSTTLSLVGSQYITDNQDLFFQAGYRVNVFVSAAGAPATNVAITMQARWRIIIIT